MRITRDNNTQLMMPINIGTVFLLFTVVLAYVGPIEYDFTHGIFLTIYLLAGILALRFGYVLEMSKTKQIELCQYRFSSGNKVEDISANELRKCRKKFFLLTVVYMVLSLLTLYSRTGAMQLNMDAFNDLGAAYYNRANITTNLTIERILVVLSPLTIAFFPYGLINWRKLKFAHKTLFCIAVVFRLFVDLVQGINKGLADIIIYLLIYTILNLAKLTIYSRLGESKFKKKIFIVGLFVGVLLIVFFLYFSANILSRTMNEQGNYARSWISLTSYLTQGYKAVDYSLSQPYYSTFGFGNSMYTLDVSRKLFGSDYLYERSYTIRNMMEHGWDYKVRWSSFFVWVGNDVSMLGVIPVLFLIGRFFAKVWRKALYTADFASIVMAGLLFQLIIYIPANNQIVQLQSAFFGTWFWVLYWHFKGKIKITFLGKRKPR